MRRTRLVATLAIAGATSASLIGFAAPAMAYPPGDCSDISSSTFVDGQSGTGAACGFASGEETDNSLESTPVSIGHSIASSAGRVTVHFTVPANFPAGQHHLVIVGDTSGHVVRIPFTVSSGTGSAPASSGSSLPFTGGNDIWQLTTAGAALVLVGGGLLMVRRRRSHTAAI